MPQRRTRQRAALESVLAGLPGFSTAQEIHDHMVASGHAVALATVYRSLQAMAEAGEVDVIRTPDGAAAYRGCGQASHHHHHLICRVCGRTVEVEFGHLEEIVAAVAAQHGFTEVDHEVELFGRCSSC